jgi:hypothetical protein
MLWVDQESYFGPDRRRRRFSLQVVDRRRQDRTAEPPPVSTALRLLRMHLLDAHGDDIDAYIVRVQSTALLAEMQDEPEAADELSNLAISLARWGRDQDMRPYLCERLDLAQAALRAHHEEAQSG